MPLKNSPNICLVRDQPLWLIIVNLDVLWAVAMVAFGNLIFGKEGGRELD